MNYRFGKNMDKLFDRHFNLNGNHHPSMDAAVKEWILSDLSALEAPPSLTPRYFHKTLQEARESFLADYSALHGYGHS